MKIELCCADTKSLEFAAKNKFNTIELCSCLEYGGLTPDESLIESALEQQLNVHVLVRPRIGDFNYSLSELKQVEKSINLLLKKNIEGIVLGAFESSDNISNYLLDLVKEHSKEKSFTFHRAFDEILDKKTATEKLIKAGFKRILSAGSPNLYLEERIKEINQLHELYGTNIEFVFGGGINSENSSFIKKALLSHSIHFSGTENQQQNSNSPFQEQILVFSTAKANTILKQVKQ